MGGGYAALPELVFATRGGVWSMRAVRYLNHSVTEFALAPGRATGAFVDMCSPRMLNTGGSVN